MSPKGELLGIPKGAVRRPSSPGLVVRWDDLRQ